MSVVASRSIAKHDMPQFYLLVVLYFIQGIPIGLTFGTIPFLLKSVFKDTSFTELGVFSMATYPYSLKILWSPIVDSVYSRKIGRRRSWIIPIQLVSGVLLFVLGTLISANRLFVSVDDAYHGRHTEISAGDTINITQLTFIFTSLIFLCATQDIAVDGWALTILSKDSISYASTAQTIGLNIGYFLSFTVFLAFNSADFLNRYIRTTPLPYGWMSLGGYMRFAGIISIIVTIYIILVVKEDPLSKNSIVPSNFELQDKQVLDRNLGTEKTQSITYIYSCFSKVLKLKPVKTLALIHLLTKFAFQCNEAATNLKLLEKGFKKEDLAVTVLIDFPFEIIFGYYVAKWSSDNVVEHKDNIFVVSSNSGSTRTGWRSKFYKFNKFLVGNSGVLSPWLYGFLGRIIAAAMGNWIVYAFPKDGQVTTGYFILVTLQHLLGSFMQTVQFVSISSFHTRIADPILGGTYMTLLNTLSNFGGTWPRFLIMWAINNFTIYQCTDTINQTVTFAKQLKNSDGSHFCNNGILETIQDGYFITNTFCITFGAFIYFSFLKRKAQHLQSLPLDAWKCQH